MIKMIEFDEGVWVPEEYCAMTNPTTSGGKSVPYVVEKVQSPKPMLPA